MAQSPRESCKAFFNSLVKREAKESRLSCPPPLFLLASGSPASVAFWASRQLSDPASLSARPPEWPGVCGPAVGPPHSEAPRYAQVHRRPCPYASAAPELELSSARTTRFPSQGSAAFTFQTHWHLVYLEPSLSPAWGEGWFALGPPPMFPRESLQPEELPVSRV